jgi:hypothetical protein
MYPHFSLAESVMFQLPYFARWLGNEQTEIERILALMMVLYTARLVAVMNAGHKQNFCGSDKGRCPNKRVAYSCRRVQISTRGRGQLMLSCGLRTNFLK